MSGFWSESEIEGRGGNKSDEDHSNAAVQLDNSEAGLSSDEDGFHAAPGRPGPGQPQAWDTWEVRCGHPTWTRPNQAPAASQTWRSWMPPDSDGNQRFWDQLGPSNAGGRERISISGSGNIWKLQP